MEHLIVVLIDGDAVLAYDYNENLIEELHEFGWRPDKDAEFHYVILPLKKWTFVAR